MPKLKPRKALLKRMKVTKSGKIIRRHCGKSHLMSTKSGKRRLRLKRVSASHRSDMKQLRRMLAM